MILRVGLIKNEATALELAEELHEIVADAVAAYCAGRRGAAPRDITPLELAELSACV